MRIGIFFGGNSREREVSFAGGRTVYDNLSKTLFQPILIFVDSFGNFVELDWHYVYKGTIRDFYPHTSFLHGNAQFQYYAENLNDISDEKIQQLIDKIGKKITLEQLSQKIDFAFLCLHGANGEDGRIQGVLEYLKIPYSGSGILPSSIGINKYVQKQMMQHLGFNCPKMMKIEREDYIQGKLKNIADTIAQNVGFPCVIKPANQGSSIGVSILQHKDEQEVMKGIEKAFFTRWIDVKDWQKLSDEEKYNEVRSIADIREGIGLPAKITYPDCDKGQCIYNPDELLQYLNKNSASDGIILEAFDAESTVLIEQFIEGKEFSCIVIEDEEGKAIALPPTEIRKGKELFDYRSKYLPGLSRKITPIHLPKDDIQRIRKECEKLFDELHFDVYARIDGFYGKNGEIFLNDPNTTSGMMPSSFFFHQAAEIGLNPSQFLTFIIRTSLRKRITNNASLHLYDLLNNLDTAIDNMHKAESHKIRVGVIFGGYSSERHISVESGRNIFEKLSSSDKYEPVPLFLKGNNAHHEVFQIPINLMLKDNADDIVEKIEHFEVHEIIEQIKKECASISEKYLQSNAVFYPEKIEYSKLKDKVDVVFIALHGRPGEDGNLQKILDSYQIPYNGSSSLSSSITINKFETLQRLKAVGLPVTNQLMVYKRDYLQDKNQFIHHIQSTFKFPFIAKPVDDGCSSAVKKIKNEEELKAFTEAIFREDVFVNNTWSDILKLKPKEEFPHKEEYLVEALITGNSAKKFLEITGGMLTHIDPNGKVVYEVFEPSEALAGDEILSLEEKFLAGEGQNITPARYGNNYEKVAAQVKKDLQKAAETLGVQGYCRIDAFVRIFENDEAETIVIEVNSLPGMTPATCIFHQAAINNYKPYDFIDKILEFSIKNKQH